MHEFDVLRSGSTGARGGGSGRSVFEANPQQDHRVKPVTVSVPFAADALTNVGE
jgi:hypothetical protein